MPPPTPSRTTASCAEAGFALIGLVVAIFIILLVLSVAAPTVARALQRDREVEAIHRAEQYTRAIRIFYKRTGRYPASLDELEKTNNIRFLRRRYNDPFTGKPDWRLIKVGENKTTVKGLFGQPLAGIASTGLGSVAGMASGIGGSSATSTGSGSTSAAGSSTSANSSSTSPNGSSMTPGSSSSGGFGTLSSQSATGFSGSGAPFLGVGLPKAGDSITVVNEQTTYPTWEFLYDPRIEQLRSRVTLFGGSMGASSATGFGSSSSSGTFGSGTTPNSSTNPTGGTSPSGNSSFGGGSFGSVATTPATGGSTSTNGSVNPSQNPQ